MNQIHKTTKPKNEKVKIGKQQYEIKKQEEDRMKRNVPVQVYLALFLSLTGIGVFVLISILDKKK